MTRHSLPEAIREHHAKNPPQPFVQARGQVGELVVAEAPDVAIRRVVLVLGVDAIGVGQVLLASNMLDQATDLDLVVESEESGAPYDVMVQAELYGPIFVEQLDRLVGRCSAEATEAIRLALRTDGASLDGWRVGMPLSGLDDPRRRFKEDELLELQEIVSACRRWLAGDSSEVISIHPKDLFPPTPDKPPDEGLDQLTRVLDLLDRLEESGRHLPWELLAMLDDDARSEVRRWRTDFGVDIWTRLQRLAFRQEAEVADEVGKEGITRVFIEAHAAGGTRTLDLVAARAADAGEVIVVEDRTRARSRLCRARIMVLEEVA